MRRLKTIASAMAVALVLVASLDYVASAATGGKFILGQLNKANKTTTLKRTTGGPALQLATTSSTASPLVVNGRGRVANLNADLLDGLDSSQLRNRSYVFRWTFNGRTQVDLDLPLPVGSYLITYSNNFFGVSATYTECFIGEVTAGIHRYTGISTGTETTSVGEPARTGAGLVTKVAGGAISLHCETQEGSFSALSHKPLEVVAIPTTVISTSTVHLPDLP
jgi:hypothetical protein